MFNTQSKVGLKLLYFLTCVKIVLTGHNFQNDPQSDVIITYSGHADAEVEHSYAPKPTIPPPLTTLENKLQRQTNIQTAAPSIANLAATEAQDGADPSVVFLKNDNEKSIANDDGYLSNSNVKYNNVNRGRVENVEETVHEDAFGDTRRTAYERRNGPVQTEPPLDDSVVFVTGRNRPEDEDEAFRRRAMDRREDDGQPFEREKTKKKVTRPKINCGRLICDNSLAPVCAGKLDDNRQWKYRLFMNQCHLTKVNCDFTYDSNRYLRVPQERCEGIANHHKKFEQKFAPTPSPQARRLFPIKPRMETFESKLKNSRRSFNVQMNGKLCSHKCPDFCLDTYEPECAKTEYGAKKVFMNHCALDRHSCSFGVVWQSRPLADCVGTEKENVRQNRGFIGWMQKVGIIDGKGRLVFET